ncbi:TonB-dependent receptor [Glycocaulis profundi]|nr:TonB-dependent receptor [Glycocaulis profundi]
MTTTAVLKARHDMRVGRGRIGATLLAGTALATAALILTGPAQAQIDADAPASQMAEAPFEVSIPPQPMASALNALSEQTGLSFVYATRDLEGIASPGARGRMSARDALDRLLAGSGFTARQMSARTVAIERPGTATPHDDAIQLGLLRVEGAQAASPGARLPYETPGSSAYISQERIQRFRGTTVGDVISGTPGVLTGENRNSGSLDLNVWGMQGMNRVPVVVDGAQQSTVVYRGYSGVASRNYLDPDLLAEMVVDKGPSTRPEAVGATGGIMVARTLAVGDILDPDESFGIRVRGELRGNTTSPPPAGTKGGLQTDSLSPTAHGASSSGGWVRSCEPSERFPDFCDRHPVEGAIPQAAYAQEAPPGSRPATFAPTGGGGSIVVAKRWGEQFDLIGAYARRSAGNYFAGTVGPSAEIGSTFSEHRVAGGTIVRERLTLQGDTRFRSGEQVVNTAYDNTSYLLKGTARWGGGHSLEVGFNRFDSDFGDMMPSEIVRGEGFRQGEASNVLSDTWTARYRYQPEDNPWLDLRVNVWDKDIELQRNLYYGLILWMASWSPGEPVMLPAAAEFSRRTGFDVDNTSRFEGTWGTLSVNYGASLTREDISSAPYPELESGEYSMDLTMDKHDGKREERSAFVSAQWEPVGWLRLDGALRYTESETYDRNETRESYRDENGRLVWGEWLNNAQSHSGLAPVVTATVMPVEGLQLYARYAEAIRTPSLFESTSGFSAGITPLASIDPERMRSREIGLNYVRADLFGEDELRLHLAYFDNRVSDYIYRVVGVGSNLEEAVFRGAEMQAEYDRGRVYGSLGLMHYDEINYCAYTPDNPPDNFVKCYPSGVGFSDNFIPPRQSASLILGTRWFDERLDVGVRGIYNSRRPDMTFVGSGQVNVRWSPHTVWDLYGSYDINERFSVDFNIDNVGDRYYADPLLIGITAAPGRTMRAGLTARF